MKMTVSTVRLRGLVVGLFFVLVPPGFAEESGAPADPAPATAKSGGAAAGRSISEIAAELANPNTNLGSLSFNFDYVTYQGDLPDADDQNAFRMTFQPILPYSLGEGTNFFVRPAIPLIFKQDVPTAGGFDDPGFNLGEISFDAALGKSFSNGLVLVGASSARCPRPRTTISARTSGSSAPRSAWAGSRSG